MAAGGVAAQARAGGAADGRVCSKFAVVSEAVPPGWSGNAVLIGRLLQGIDSAGYCLLSSDEGLYLREDERGLPAPVYRLRPPWRFTRGTRFGLLFPRALANAAIGILTRGVQIVRIVKRERCDAIVVYTGDFHDPPGAYLASRVLRVPLYFYICDSYAHRELWDPARHRLSPRLERTIVRAAAGVVCANETLRDDLVARCGVEPLVIHHPCDLSAYAVGVADGKPDSRSEQKIVYTGTVYEAQLDALRNLQDALATSTGGDASLHVYTGQSRVDLLERGLREPFVYHDHRPADGVAVVQQDADILFLPLAFSSRYPDVIRTSAPMKFGEYLAAGRPILAHVPADSFVARYCRRHECALVVDEPDPAKLREAVARLAADSALRTRLAANARERAFADFDLDNARAQFMELLGFRG